jgi:hypothetical protein
MVTGLALIACSFTIGAEDAPPCRPHLVHCNIGDAYSGTFHQVSVLEYAGGKVTRDLTAHVTLGKVRCEGTLASTDPSVPAGAIKGEGLLIVEWGVGTDDDPGMPWYRIAASCPGVDGSTPVGADASDMDTYKQPRRSGFALLKGSQEEQHPDADPNNGVTGSIRMEWSLSRDGK